MIKNKHPLTIFFSSLFMIVTSRTNKKRRTSTSGTPSPEPKIVPKFGKRKQRDHDNTTLGAEIGTRQETRKEDSDAGQKSSLCKDEPTPSQIHPHPDIQEMGERSDDQQKDAVMESLSISTQDQNTENCVAEDKVCTMPSGESDNAELGQVESDVNQSMASEITEIVDEGKRHDRLDLQLGLSKDEDASDVVTPGDSCKQGNSRRNLSTTAKEETSSDEVVTAKSDDKEDHYRPDAERTPTCDVSLQKNGTSLISHSEHAEKASSFKIAKDSNMLPGFVSKENDDTHKENNTQHENTGRNSHTPADRNSDQFDMDEFAEKLNEHHEPKIKAGNSSELLFSVEEKNGNTDLVQTDGKSQMNGTSTEDVNRLKPDDAPVCEQGEHTLDQSISNEGDERKMKEYDGNTERSNEIVGGHHPYDILDCTQPFEIAGLDALSTNSPTTNITAADLSINDEISSKKTDENDLVDINKESAVTTGNEATVCDNSSSSKVASKSVTEDGSGSFVLIPLPPQEKASTEKDNSASTTNLAAKCVRDGEIEVKKPTFDGEPSSDQTKDSAVDIEEAPQFCLSASGGNNLLFCFVVCFYVNHKCSNSLVKNKGGGVKSNKNSKMLLGIVYWGLHSLKYY